MLLWTEQFGTSSGDTSYGVSADGLGNVYLSGSTFGSLYGANAGSFDSFISKYDGSGTLLWSEQFGTSSKDFVSGVSADGLGDIYLSGLTEGSLDGTNAGSADAFVAKYSEPAPPTPGDANGDGHIDGTDYLIWAGNYGQGPNDGLAVPEPGAFVMLLIGVVAFFVAVYWVTYQTADQDKDRPGWGEIWIRFPKFILGFLAASCLFPIIIRNHCSPS